MLALFAMICWGLAPVFGKLGLSKIDPLSGLIIRTYISAALLTGFIFRKGIIAPFREISLKSAIFLGIEGILATLVGDLAYYAAIKYGDVSFVTIVMSCSPIISIVTAILFLNEQITLYRLIGTILIVVGLAFIMR